MERPIVMPRKLAAVAIATAFLALLALPVASQADQPASALTFHDGHFEPAVLSVSAGEPVHLTVVNQDSAAIEFESFELNRERVVPPGHTITVLLPKLDPGEYHFFDDFNRDAGQGTITAR